MNWSYVLVGFIVGTCTAYSGVGAGAITTPLLIIMGVGTNTAIGSDLLFALGTRFVAMFAHVQKRTVHLPVLWRLSLGGLPGAIIGVLIKLRICTSISTSNNSSTSYELPSLSHLSCRRPASSSIAARRRSSPGDNAADAAARIDRLFCRPHGQHHLDRCRLADASAVAAGGTRRCLAASRRHGSRLRSRRSGAVIAGSLASRRR